MGHPSETRLALYAGGDLGRWGRWLVGRHVGECPDCQREIADFSALRSDVCQVAELPEIEWQPLAAEMKANIRLGIEAGECVSRRPALKGAFSGRALAACLSLALLLVASLWLERPTPREADFKTARLRGEEAVVLESSGPGIQVTEGEQAMMLLNPRAHDVSYSSSGSTMRARYVDADTGYVTINNVYV